MSCIPWAAEPFFKLIDELRQNGFNLGTSHYSAVQDLLLALRALGDWPQDAEALKGFLGPVLCSSAAEQKRFEHHYRNWLQVQPWSRGLPQSAQAGSGGRRLGADKLPLKKVLLGSLAALILAVAFLHFLPLSPPNPEPPAPVGLSNPTPPVDRLQALLASMEMFRSRRSIKVPIKRPLWERLLPTYTNLQQLLAPLACLLLIAAWQIWVRRNRPILERESVLGNPRLWPIVVHPWVERLFWGGEARRAIQELRRHRHLPDAGLDVKRTAEKTAASAGFFVPVLSQRKVSPEYLVLIDRASSRDQQAEYFSVMTARLKENGVYAARFYFDGDPRHCIPPNPREPHRTLADLASRYPEHRLLILGDGQALIDPVDAGPRGWVELFETWKLRAVLTPERPGNWGQREAALASAGFLVLPAGLEGLQGLAEAVESEPRSGWPCDPWSSFPELLREWPQEWVHREAPEQAEIDRLCLQLRNYLDRDGYLWLCACAVYPELHWNLTLALARELEGLVGAERVATTERLLSLARLPWFRHASMPDWLRSRLIDEMSPRQAQAVREAIYEMLERPEAGAALAGEEAAADGLQLDIARQRGPSLKRLWKSRPPMESALRDQVFLKLMLADRLAKLAVRTPRILWKLIYREGAPLLGLRPAFVFAALGVLGLCGWVALGESRPKTERLQPEAIPVFRTVEGAESSHAESEEPFQHYYRAFYRTRESDRSIADFLDRQGADPSGLWNGRDPVQDGKAEGAFSLYRQWLRDEVSRDQNLPSDSFYLSKDGQADWLVRPILLFPNVPEVGIQVLGPETLAPGEEAEYELRIENYSPASVSELSVTFHPDGLSYRANSRQAPLQGSEPTWRISSLAAHSSRVILMTVLAQAEGEFNPCASLSARGLQSRVGCRRVEVQPLAGRLSVSLAGPSEVAGCGPVEIQAEVRNVGQRLLSGVQGRLEIPPGLHLEEAGAATIEARSLGPGDARIFQLQLRADRAGTYTTRLRFASRQNAGAQDSLETVFQPTLLQVQEPILEDHLNHYALQLRVQNVGRSTAENVFVRYRIPPRFEFLEANNGGKHSGSHILWKFDELAPSESRDISAKLRFLGNFPGPDSGGALAWADCARQVSSVPPIDPKASSQLALGLQIEDSRDPVRLGGLVTYRLTLAKSGEAAISGLEIKVELGHQLRYFHSAPPQGGRQSVNGQVVLFQLPQLLPGNNRVSWTVSAQAISPGAAAVRAEITAAPEGETASATEQTRIENEGRLEK